MAFKDLSEFYDPDLHLPYKGKTYTVPAADLDTGLYLQTIFNIGVKANSGQLSDQAAAQFDDDEEVDFMERCLGRELLDELRADKVPTPVASLMRSEERRVGRAGGRRGSTGPGRMCRAGT